MKTLTKHYDLVRLTKAIPSQMTITYRPLFWPCLLLVAFVLSLGGLSPAAQAGDPSRDGTYPNQDYFSRDYRTVILADEPAMYWRLGESRGTLGFDESTGLRDLAYVANPTLGLSGAILGDPNTAVGFNGSNQFAEWDLTKTISGTFTVEAWVQEKNIYPTQTFFNTCSQIGGLGIANFGFDFGFDIVTLDFTQKVVRFQVGDGAQWLASSSVPFDVQPGVWYHVAAVVSPAGATYYLDGLAIGSAVYNGIPLLCDATHRIEFGGGTMETENAGTHGVRCVIDEVAIYDYVLTADQVENHYLTGRPPGE